MVVLLKKRGRVIGDEPGNTDSDPDVSEKVLAMVERSDRAGGAGGGRAMRI